MAIISPEILHKPEYEKFWYRNGALIEAKEGAPEELLKVIQEHNDLIRNGYFIDENGDIVRV